MNLKTKTVKVMIISLLLNTGIFSSPSPAQAGLEEGCAAIGACGLVCSAISGACLLVAGGATYAVGKHNGQPDLIPYGENCLIAGGSLLGFAIVGGCVGFIGGAFAAYDRATGARVDIPVTTLDQINIDKMVKQHEVCAVVPPCPVDSTGAPAPTLE